MAFTMAMPWNEGEAKMHNLMRIPPLDNPTSAMLTPQASFMLQKGPLLAIGTLDSHLRPWTTLWGGSAGFSEPLGGGFVGTRTLVDGAHDPVVQALVGEARDGEMLQPQDGGKMLAGLAMDLMTRKRVKVAGRMVAGTVKDVDVEAGDGEEEASSTKQKQIQLVTKIDQSLGNCPKYLNQYQLRPTIVQSTLLSQSPALTDEGKKMIQASDMFFLTTTTDQDMDVNHRGGAPGFVRLISPTELVYPEYSGNRLYQSLGNLQLNPKTGLTFPNYETGTVLYITGTATILVGPDAANLLPGSNLAIKITIVESRLVQQGLPFRATRHTPSPYNPRIRTLATEGNLKSNVSAAPTKAQLVKKEMITATIARFTFTVPGGIGYSAGQWVAMDFKSELDIGYEHMRDDDPTSLNDDFVRTFTISSIPTAGKEKQDQFAITIRKVGPVTKSLFAQSDRAGFEVPLLGVGGGFEMKQEDGKMTPFVAGGVGITPLLGQLGEMNMAQGMFKLFWTLRAGDVALVVDVLSRFHGLAKATAVYLTGDVVGSDVKRGIETLRGSGVKVAMGRLSKEDLEDVDAKTWYLCAGKLLRKEVLSWLNGKEVVFENFDY